MSRNRRCVLDGLFPVAEAEGGNTLVTRSLTCQLENSNEVLHHTRNSLILHILQVDELLRVSDQVWDGAPHGKVSASFIEDKLLHSSQHHPE